ncbi:MAG: low molecular weight phosphotyrosine protein phosphatase [Alphaproteobacteria bacterium]|nr:low molecular weight phosphotyrosine protein phosphatase [Alphaproteobacteria bacterium]MBU1525983.1 low molecular weight phosphotyrosine protein phosphatase [Alphaproteobacteria bacterium]MBU2350391.1 low molecular weight phosphotyrosine protein phosphatase [Alphaproteobacteria bacterium]MBU2381625.1 low molecular weight phosphotyrosine protein phosphatase [Alphaproteobacteria bacterium]
MASSLLFVCLGNICRSPLAEGALRAEAARRGLALTVDSAGTGGWHAGEAPDRRAQATARRHGVDVSGLRARQVTPDDFRRFDHVIALDHDNLTNLRALAPADATAQLSLLLDWVPCREGQAVADPWFGDEAGFETTWADVTAAARAIADALSAP